LGASAKFSVNGKTTSKKDLALQAIAHGSAFVAQIAMGANDVHAVRTLQEAEAFPGPSLVIAYSHCIAHGYDMAFGAFHQQNAVKSGYWPLFRYNPLKNIGERFSLDSKQPVVDVKEFLAQETRFSILDKLHPEHAAQALSNMQHEIEGKWQRLNTMKGL
jgi:pyruvate-ferredoxin/flavodoxin oxidoreductase